MFILPHQLQCRINVVELLETKVDWSSLVIFAARFKGIAAAQENILIRLIADSVKSIVVWTIWLLAIESKILLYTWPIGFSRRDKQGLSTVVAGIVTPHYQKIT